MIAGKASHKLWQVQTHNGALWNLSVFWMLSRPLTAGTWKAVLATLYEPWPDALCTLVSFDPKKAQNSSARSTPRGFRENKNLPVNIHVRIYNGPPVGPKSWEEPTRGGATTHAVRKWRMVIYCRVLSQSDLVFFDGQQWDEVDSWCDGAVCGQFKVSSGSPARGSRQRAPLRRRPSRGPCRWGRSWPRPSRRGWRSPPSSSARRCLSSAARRPGPRCCCTWPTSPRSGCPARPPNAPPRPGSPCGPCWGRSCGRWGCRPCGGAGCAHWPPCATPSRGQRSCGWWGQRLGARPLSCGSRMLWWTWWVHRFKSSENDLD